MSTEHDTTTGSTAASAQGDWRDGVRASRSKQLIVLALTALLVGLGTWLVGHRTASSDSGADNLNGAQAVQVTGDTSGPAPKVGTAAQDFTGRSVDGKLVTLSKLKGKGVWLTFGASWCTACRAETPDIQATYEKAKASGLEVVSVNMQEMPADVKAYADKLGLTYPQIADPDTALASRYRVMGLPTHFFIDKTGVLRAQHVGVLGAADMDEQVAKITG